MNIEDISGEELWPKAVEFYGTDNPLEIVFARQRELMEKYLVIEAEILGEELVVIPVDIHSARGQRALKERAWWVTEELVEALDALGEDNTIKFFEELSDCIHFITELWILTGIHPSAIWYWDSLLGSIDCPSVRKDRKKGPLSPTQTRYAVTDIIVSLGRAMWQLRNKSWKKSQVLTDLPRFTRHLVDTYDKLMGLLYYGYDLTLKEICLLYLKKSEVNLFRQRSNY